MNEISRIRNLLLGIDTLLLTLEEQIGAQQSVGYSHGYQQGQAEGYAAGLKRGREEGYDEGLREGFRAATIASASGESPDDGS